MSTFIGISFPFRKGSTSFPQTATDVDLIKQSLVQLILVAKGERVMRPDVGSLAYRYVFEDNNDVLAELFRSEVTGVISKYEPRVALQNVEVTTNDTTITIKILYIIRTNGQQDSLTLTIPKA